jgi:hypothetical protein
MLISLIIHFQVNPFVEASAIPSSNEPILNEFDASVNTKQKGAHIFGVAEDTNFNALSENNLEWITMVPWGFQKNYDSPKVSHDRDSLNRLRQNDHWVKKINTVHEAGFKVFLKPHLWIHEPSDGKWRSDIYPSSSENWALWKETYRDFILRYANVAESSNVDMYCIGVEFSRLTKEKPEFWRTLIADIRKVYSGKIIYAANWYEEYEEITFWKDLDYIGIQAYFPLTDKMYPSEQQISKGWKKHLSKLESTSTKSNRQIIFTEMGYKSTANSASKPWEWVENTATKETPDSEETQVNCYKAFFNTVWDQEWFAGVHIWQMRSDYLSYDHEDFLYDFTPQGKPALQTITKGFE